MGLAATSFMGVGTDAVEELERLCREVKRRFPKAVFFAGKLVFEQENFLTRLLHNHTPFTLEQRLQFEGLEMMILPIRVFTSVGTQPSPA